MQSRQACHQKFACNEEESIYGHSDVWFSRVLTGCFRPIAAIRSEQKQQCSRVLFFELGENNFPTIAKIRTRSPSSGDREDPVPRPVPLGVGHPQ